MNPSDEMPFRHEIKRLRERLEATGERHAAELDAIRRSISELEARLSKAPDQEVELSAMQRAKIPAARTEPVKVPPPLPGDPEPVEKLELEKPKEMASPRPATPRPVPASDSSFELDFGKVWFVRIGIVILLTGLVFLGNYAYQNWIREMPNGVRLAALFACAGVLVETGRRLAAKENLNRFGEVLLAGGMAFFYYCTFAAHHVGRLRVIDSPVLAAVLLFGAAGVIAAASWLRQAKATAALGFVLAAYATMLQPIGWMSCVSNLVLAAAGLFFMSRPGWSGPGWASMLGSYGAFFGWQVLGATEHGTRTEDPATLWFLPPLWVMFAIPGVVGRFRESLGDRARAWFTAINNALFFLLFSGVWLLQNGETDYWKVAAIFGPVLIGLGIIGRRQDTTAGGVNISQGIAVATLALVLKLDGHHLALVLAFESFALAIASWKFRGRSEAVFSFLAAVGSSYLIGQDALSFHALEKIPVWSAALVAALIVAASLVTVRIERRGENFNSFVQLAGLFLFLMATAIVSHLCLFRLGEAPALLTAVLLSGVLPVASRKLDPKTLQPEVPWIGLWFLGISAWLGFHVGEVWPLGVAVAVSLAACWFWHRASSDKPEEPVIDLTRFPTIPAWAFAIAAPLFVWQAGPGIRSESVYLFIFCHIAALLLAGVAIPLRCGRLLITSALLGFINLGLIIHPGVPGTSHRFIAVALALAAVAMLRAPWAASNFSRDFPILSGYLFRLTAFVAYCAAWHGQSPENWADWLALTAIALTLSCVFTRRKLLVETLGLIAVALVSFSFATLTSPWSLSPDESSWRGLTVVLALLSLVLTYRQRPALIKNPERRHEAVRLLAGLTCFVTTVWATQMLVWRFGWKPAAVLWTVLGFAYVSAGLWQRLHILRVCGFILLVLSLGKLFVSDVWDFTTFMRVVSFIVLGAALILLGLFYNKFAHAIKALLDDEKAAGMNEDPRA